MAAKPILLHFLLLVMFVYRCLNMPPSMPIMSLPTQATAVLFRSHHIASFTFAENKNILCKKDLQQPKKTSCLLVLLLILSGDVLDPLTAKEFLMPAQQGRHMFCI